MMDIEDIRNRAQGVSEGRVSRDEVDFAREILLSSEGDISSAIYVVGLCGDSQDAELIEFYLKPEYVGVYGELALKALCRYLKLMPKYRSLIRKLILDGSDIWPDGRSYAIRLSPDYMNNYEDSGIGRALLEIFTNDNDRDRVSARNSLVKILNINKRLEKRFVVDFRISDHDSTIIYNEAIKKFEYESRLH